MGYVVASFLVFLLAGFVVFCAIAKQSKPSNLAPGEGVWSTVLNVATLISDNNADVQKAIKFAMSDQNILNENSEFLARAQEVFGDNIVEWIDEDLSKESVPAAVFKTVLHGYGYMAYLDWKDIAEPNEAMHSLNGVLRTLGEEEVDASITQALAVKCAEFNNSNKTSAVIVEALLAEAEKRKMKVAWFDEGGDSYAFFVVKSDIFDQLSGLVIDDEHRFVEAPKF